MDLREYQKEIVKIVKIYSKTQNINLNKDFALKKLFEEVGEFSQAVLISEGQARKKKRRTAKENKKELSKELADVLGLVFFNAEVHNIDLTEAFETKWFKYRGK